MLMQTHPTSGGLGNFMRHYKTSAVWVAVIGSGATGLTIIRSIFG